MRAKFWQKKEIQINRRKWSEFRFDGNTFTTRMDPDAQATKYPVPYQLFRGRNSAYNVDYLGNANDADNTVAVATLDQGCSQWYLYDVGTLPLQFAYLGLGIDSNSHNDAYNQQFAEIMLTSLSSAYATQLTDLAFLQNVYTTTLPRMTSGDEAKVGFMVWYQSVVQNVMSIMAKYNSTLSLADYMVKMGYGAESPSTIEMLNLLKKNNVYSLFDQVGVAMQQEYADLDWFKEIAILNGMQSRVADDAQHPLLTVIGSTHIPNVKVTSAGGTVLLDTATDPSYSNISVTVNGTTTVYTLQQLAQHIMEELDPTNIIGVARMNYYGLGGLTPNQAINELIECMKAFLSSIAKFRSDTVNLRTFLMVLQDSTALNRWVVDTPYVKPSRPRIQAEPQFFKLIDDLFRAFGATGSKLIPDTTTRKWKVYTLWRGGEGIPDYDYFDGGFAIATSVRDIPAAGSYLSPDYMFPRMFYRYSDSRGTFYQAFLSRRGDAVMMQPMPYTGAQVSASAEYAHLNALSDLGMDITVPALGATGAGFESAAMIKLLATVFGLGELYIGTGTTVPYYRVVDSELIFFVGREFGNFAEASVDYLTARAPMRQTDKDVTLGFKFSIKPSSNENM